MTPTINVNLQRCACINPPRSATHFAGCPGAPVLIPCPVQRSVTFSVALGECTCLMQSFHAHPHPIHAQHCPARPVRVSCSISGKTWEESEVMTDTDERPALTNEQRFLAAHACNARWALVKALVLNRIVELTPWLSSPASLRLMYQRDAVFAALVDMARAEEALLAAEQRFHALLPQWPPEVGLANPMGRGSTQRLAAYVEHLREQVEVLP